MAQHGRTAGTRRMVCAGTSGHRPGNSFGREPSAPASARVYAQLFRRDPIEQREITEDYRIAVRGPVGVHLISRFVQKRLGLATFRGNKIDLSGASRRGVEVRRSEE